MDDKFIRKVLSNMKCGVCSAAYEPDNISILAHREDLWFISVYCPSCKSQGLVAAVISEGKAPEVVSELSEEEVARFSTMITSDDVIDVHSFLKEFDGDFLTAFSDEKNEGEETSPS